MASATSTKQALLAENAELHARLEDAEETLRAIRAGEVDALVVESKSGTQLFILQSTDAESNRFRSDILGKVSDAVIAVDPEERVTFFNAAAERQYRVTAGEALGRKLSEIYACHWSSAGAAAAAWAALRERGEWLGETLHRTPDGREFHVESSVTMLRGADGAEAGIVAAIRDITERKQASEAQARLAAIIASSDDAIIGKTLDGIITTWNPGAEKVFGYSAADAIGQSMLMLIPPERASEEPGILARISQGESVRHFETIRLRKDGTRIHVSVTISPIKDATGKVIGASNIARDITDRKRAEETLQQNEALFSTIIDQAPGGVYVVDEQFRMQQVNSLARPTFAAAEPVIGRNFAEVMEILWGPELGEEITKIFRHTLDTGERYISPRFTHLRHDLGEQKSYEWETQRVTLPNGRLGLVCYFTDVTEQRALEDELLTAKEAAEAASQAKDRFLAVLSHELRTPLTPVLMAVAALEHDPTLRPDVREDLAMMKRNIDLETKLIDDLLDLNRITSGKLVLEIEPVDLNETARHVCGICRPAARQSGIQLEMEFDDAAGVVAADTSRLQQILWNVVNNAIKFTPEGGTIRVATKRLSDARREVRVHDSGRGIPAEVLPRIFDAFEQGNEGITRQFGGLGLGLAICKALIDLHGGSIRAESAGPGHGSTFIIELPGEIVCAIPKLPDAALAINGEPHPLRLLLVEDHKDTARTLARLLRVEGFAVLIASDVASATAIAEREPFDLLVSDLGLPDGNGYEIMRRVRAIRSVPGIAMSGYGMNADVRRSRDAGFMEHLVKPIIVPQLIAAIRRVTDERQT